MTTEGRRIEPPELEIYPRWQLAGTVKDVASCVDNERRVLRVRIPPKARNGTRLRVPEAVEVRIRLLYLLLLSHGLVTALVVAGLLSNAGAISLLVGVLWLLLVYCRAYVRTANGKRANAWPGKRTPQASGFRYYLRFFGVLYLVPIWAAVAFHVLLATTVTAFDDLLSVGQLVSLQQWLEKISEFFSKHLKLTEPRMLAALVVVYLLSVILTTRSSKIPSGAARGLNRLADLYGKYSGPIAAGLATLAAFTLFGTHAGAPGTDLLRIKSNQVDYAKLAHHVEARLAQEVATRLYQDITGKMPPEYRDALTLRIDGAVTMVRTRAEQARAVGVSDAKVDQMVRNEAARKQNVDARPRNTPSPTRTGARRQGTSRRTRSTRPRARRGKAPHRASRSCWKGRRRSCSRWRSSAPKLSST